MKKITSLLLLLIFIFISGCKRDTEEFSFNLQGASKVEVGKVIQLTTDTEEAILWSVDNTNIANVLDGYVYGISVGKTIVRATLASDSTKYRTLLINVVANTGSTGENIIISGENQVELEQIINLTANTSADLVWVSSNPLIATVADGVVTTISKGTVTIRAYEEANPLNFGSLEINVVEKKLIIMGVDQIELHQEEVFYVTDDVNVNWSSSNMDVATIDEDGNLIANELGTTVITAVNKLNLENLGTKTVTVIAPSKKADTEFEYYHTKILSISETQYKMELLDVETVNYTVETKVYKLNDTEVSEITLNDLYIGMENVYVEIGKDSNTITKILVDGDTGFSNIRVAIRKSIDDIANTSTLYHDSITFQISGNTLLKTFDNVDSINLYANQILNISVSNNKMIIKLDNVTIFETVKRIILVQEEDVELVFTSIYRGRFPSYADNMEVSIHKGRLLAVNDIEIDKYLTKVVPSEMPTSWHIEALKAQAIAARTYAYMDILNKSNDRYGYTVDDSVKSQVYNNTNPVSRSTLAVNETKGLIMTHNDKPISAFYYSTSSGLTASGHEVWIEDKVTEPIDYLIGQNLTNNNGNPLHFDYQNEDSMLNFFRTITVSTPDLNASYHRWRVKFSYVQLTNTLNRNLKISYAAAPQSILTKVNNVWVSRSIPDNIGNVQNIFVSNRGSSGVVISLDIVTSTGEYRIINQYNIRFTIRPRDAGSNVYTYFAKNTDTSYLGPSTNASVLNSGFFAIEYAADEVTFYGGGNGHGVGMSQYGAYGLATQGKNYEEILNTYYSNVDFTDITYLYTPIDNYRDYFGSLR